MIGLLSVLFHIFSYLVLIYFLLLNGFYIFFMALSFFGISRYRHRTEYVRMEEIFLSPLAKPISIIAPAYNEENSIVESVRNLLSLEYPQYEVIVVNDGSTDATLKKLIEAFSLKKTQWVFRKVVDHKPVLGIYVCPANPKLIVVDKLNGKKADAMNAGLNIAHYPLFCAVDSDCLIDRDCLLKVVRPFLEDPERTAGVGGIVRLINGCTVKSGQVTRIRLPRNILARFQTLEYFRAFLGGRIGMSLVKSILIISGAFGVFRKDLILKCGGYRPASIGEDLDLVVRLRKYLHDHKIPYTIHFLPDPICWTEVPETLRALRKQRNRWHRGLIEAFMYSRRMIFNPRYGVTGLFAMPFYLIFELFGPLIELLGYAIFILCLLFRLVDYPFAFIFFLLSIALGTLLSVAALLLEEFSLRRFPRTSDVLLMAVYCILENIFYRQYLAFVRGKAFIDYFRGKKEWGAMDKKGFSAEIPCP
ncbi:MAG: glycosyltransferase [Candidatus Aminicenantes bacterium]|nr:glycosyltransferase [Candidatus Aminicenantes bacterium]